MSEIELSVIVPVYNVELYLEECLDSLIQQRVGRCEILIINDGSSDGSQSICEKYAQLDKRIRIINQVNAGLSSARNTGITNAVGEFITFIDSDDYIDPNMLSSMIEVAKNLQLDLVACGYKKVDENNSLLYEHEWTKEFSNRVLNRSEAVNAFILNDILPMAWGKVYKRELFINHGFYYPVGVNYEDSVLTLEVILQSEKIYIVNENFYFYRLREGSIVSTPTKKNILDQFHEYLKTIDKVYQIDDSLLLQGRKEEYKTRMLGILVAKYLKYQEQAFRSLVISEEIDYNRNFVFFGASKLGNRYINIGQRRFKNLVFVDNDLSKHNSRLSNYVILPPNDIRHLWDGDYKIIITSMYFLDIIMQLFELRIIQKLSDVFIFEGRTEIEQAYIKGFKMVYDKIYNYVIS